MTRFIFQPQSSYQKNIMPVQCSIAIASLSTEEFRELDYQVMRHAFDSQNDLGRLADERIYQTDLTARLQKSGISVLREVKVTLSFENFCKSLYLDLLVDSRGVYELKVAKAISDAHIGQLLTYLHLLDLSRGKIINFGSSKVRIEVRECPLSQCPTTSFQCCRFGLPWFRALSTIHCGVAARLGNFAHIVRLPGGIDSPAWWRGPERSDATASPRWDLPWQSTVLFGRLRVRIQTNSVESR